MSLASGAQSDIRDDSRVHFVANKIVICFIQCYNRCTYKSITFRPNDSALLGVMVISGKK